MDSRDDSNSSLLFEVIISLPAKDLHVEGWEEGEGGCLQSVSEGSLSSLTIAIKSNFRFLGHERKRNCVLEFF